MPKRLVIIDISGFIYRSFHAIRPLNAPDGRPVNAVYGVLGMFLKLMSDLRPKYLFLAKDGPSRKTFRSEIYKDYKVTRQSTPEDLIPQFEILDELFLKLHLKSIRVDGLEADDIIGSAATQFRDDFDEIYIISSDKDLMQFVDEKVKVLDTYKNILYGKEEVFEKLGVYPHQVVDYLSLVGDSSDNIPGVRGIGAKGAQKLVAEYKTLENCIENADKVQGKKTQESLKAYADDAFLSKKLLKIREDAPLGVEAADLEYEFRVDDELLSFVRSLGFKTHRENLELLRFRDATENEIIKEEEKVVEKKYEEKIIRGKRVATLGPVEEVVALGGYLFSGPTTAAGHSMPVVELRSVTSLPAFVSKEISIFFQVEGTKADIQIVSLMFTDSSSYVYEANKENVKEILNELLFLNDLSIITASAKELYLYTLSEEISFDTKRIFDITQAHYVIDSSWKHDLSSLIKRYLDKEDYDEYLESAVLMRPLADILKKELSEKNLEKIYRDIDLPVTKVLAKLERRGVMLNTKFLDKLGKDFEKKLLELEDRIEMIAKSKINLRSPRQVAELLFEKLKLPSLKKTKTGQSTDAETLYELAQKNLSEVPEMILSYRELEKLSSTYIKALPLLINPQTKRVHPTFNMAVAATGRLSCENPNLQNIPVKTDNGKLIRKAFVAEKGKVLLSADYSQVELRLLAHFSEDPTMIKSFQSGEDIHAQTAAQVLGINLSEVSSHDRSLAKTVNFGLMYGQSAFGLSSTLHISRMEAKTFIDTYFEKFSYVKAYLDSLKEFCEKNGYVETLYGRKRFLPDIHSQNRTVKSQAERAAINSPFQGTAADIIKLAMIDIDKKFEEKKFKSKMILQVHDELIFELEENELDVVKETVKSCMENVVDLRVPLIVSIGVGVNWCDLK